MSTLTIERSGPFASVQDLGRTGYRHLGVARAGAADRAALKLGNRLVGNPETAAGIEVLFGGLAFRVQAPTTIALTGAWVEAFVDGTRALPMLHATRVAAGCAVMLGVPRGGLRTYVAIAGGVDVPATLSSRSTDTLGKLGPAPLAPGMKLPVGVPAATPPAVDAVPIAAPAEPLDVVFDPGPRHDMFVDGALSAFVSRDYVVTSDVSRIGIKLEGPALRRAEEFETFEMRSEGMLPGSIQVPPSGAPIVLLADCPTTGGYPVIGVVRDRYLDGLAQLRPGSSIRFRLPASASRTRR